MNIISDINIETALLLALLALSFLIFLYYYLFNFKRVVGYKFNKRLPSELRDLNPDVSIVVVVGDDIDYIENVLPQLLNQKYDGNFNIVVVHDSPDSETSINLLDELDSKHDNLYLTRIKADPKFKHTPKLPITIGVKAAKYDNILFTTTAAYPSSDRWLSFMAKGFVYRNTLVVGYSYTPKYKGILNSMTRAIEIVDSLLALTKSIDQQPYSVQSTSNMGYTSSLFFSKNGFGDHLRYNKGEGDLFIQRIAENIETSSTILHPDASMVNRESLDSFGSWYSRRKYNTHSRIYYPLSTRLYMNMLPISSVLFWLSAVASSILGGLYVMAAVGVVILLRILVMTIVLRKLSKRTGCKVPYFTYFISDIIIFVDYLILDILRRITPNKSLWL